MMAPRAAPSTAIRRVVRGAGGPLAILVVYVGRRLGTVSVLAGGVIVRVLQGTEDASGWARSKCSIYSDLRGAVTNRDGAVRCSCYSRECSSERLATVGERTRKADRRHADRPSSSRSFRVTRTCCRSTI